MAQRTIPAQSSGPPEAKTSIIDLIKPWKLPPQNTYIFKNANVVDTAKGEITPHQTVKLSNGLIESVGDDHSVVPSAGDIVVNLDGKYLCPGLMDCHIHIVAVAGEASLAAGIGQTDMAVSHFRQAFLAREILHRGFTTVRDTGGATLALKEALADDVFPGPRLFMANKALSQTGGHGDLRSAHTHASCCGSTNAVSIVVDGVANVIQAARDQIRTGGDFLKIMTSGGVASPTDKLENIQFTSAEVKAIVEVAESYNTYVTAHAYTPKAIRHAVDNGVKGIEHGNLIDKETAEYMAKNGVWLTPTLVTYDAMGSDKYAGFLPPVSRAKNKEVLEQGLQSLRLAEEAGVTMCHGTDLLGPLWAEQSREFSLRGRALSAKTVLQGATVNPARMLKQENFLGQIKSGFAADVLVLNKNPLEDIAILDEPEKHILAVIKNGRVYKSRWRQLSDEIVPVQTFIE